MLPLLLDLALKSTLLLTLAFLLALQMRTASAAARHLLFLLTLTALLFLPLFTTMLPALPLLPTWSHSQPSIPTQKIETHLVIAQPLSETATPTAPLINQTSTSRMILPTLTPPIHSLPPTPTSWPSLLTTLYTVGLLLSLLPLALALFALHRLERRASPLHNSPWPHLLRTAQSTLHLTRPITLLEADHPTTMPMTFGLLRPRILLPRNTAAWSDDRRSLVLLHELAHIQRRDPLTQLLARLLCTLYWFHPLVWLAARRLRIEAELACDDLVLAGAARSHAHLKPSAYADELLTLASAYRAPTLAAAAAITMARPKSTHLHTRIHAILDHSRNRKTLTKKILLSAITTAALILLPLAALRAQTNPPKNTPSPTTQPTPTPLPETPAAHTSHFPHVVHFTTGDGSFAQGDSIGITEIRGTADTIHPFNTYQIKGTYTLASMDQARLAVYVTSVTPNDTHHDPYDARQTVIIDKGSGTFTVILPFLSPGYPHLSIYPINGGSASTYLYFGTTESLANPTDTHPLPKPEEAQALLQSQPINTSASITAETVSIAPSAEGLLTTLNVKEGQHVKSGELLFTLDSTDAQYAYNVATVQFDSAKSKLDDKTKAAAAYVINTSELNEAKTALTLAQLAMQKAKMDIARASVYSPIDGTISESSATLGQFIAKNTKVLTIVNTTNLTVEMAVSEGFLNRIRVGQPFTLTVDAYPQDPWSGEITFISPTMDPSQFSVATCRIKGTLKGDLTKLKPGMNAAVTINPN